jgi:hypothetical protein
MIVLPKFPMQRSPSRQILLAAWFFITFTNFSFWQAAFTAIGTSSWHNVLFDRTLSVVDHLVKSNPLADTTTMDDQATLIGTVIRWRDNRLFHG